MTIFRPAHPKVQAMPELGPPSAYFEDLMVSYLNIAM